MGIRPRERAARIVDAVAHGDVDVARAGDACVTASAASLASIATVRMTTRPATSSIARYGDAGRLQAPIAAAAASSVHVSARAIASRVHVP
jgi:hypothetical protein